MDGILAVGEDDVTILESTLPGQIIGKTFRLPDVDRVKVVSLLAFQ